MLPLVPIGATLAAGGLVGSLLQKSNSGVPDISGELANIKSIFENLRARAEAGINKQAAQGRSAAAANLAARGVYSSPVSENTFNRLEDSRLQAIGDSNAQLSGQEAQTRSQLLSSMLGLTSANNARKDAINAGRWGAITGFGANLATMGLGSPAATPAAPGAAPVLSWQDLLKQMQNQPSNYVTR